MAIQSQRSSRSISSERGAILIQVGVAILVLSAFSMFIVDYGAMEAFKNFAARTKVEDVRALVAMLVQTDRFGTSVAMALRTHAETSRTKRRQRAEERAAKIGVKLVFPLVFFIFPSLFVVALGPAMIAMYEGFDKYF